MDPETLARACPAVFPRVLGFYGWEDRAARPVETHEGGRNVVIRTEDAVIRLSCLPDRSREDYLAETEFVRYLAERGAGVADAIPGLNGSLVQETSLRGEPLFVCAFKVAPGVQIADMGYRYRAGAPLSEYFFNTGKALGKMHALAKIYRPAHPRQDFFSKYNRDTLDRLVPAALPRLKDCLFSLIEELRALSRSRENYGTVHFDFSDGNYNIDYATGRITAFDFDNALRFFYLYDLANLWAHGVGWVQFEPDAEKRRAFMDGYFREIVRGYRTETEISDEELTRLPLFLRAVHLENILDEWECQAFAGEDPSCDEEQSYRIRCMLDGAEYLGFFGSLYSPASPFLRGERFLPN